MPCAYASLTSMVQLLLQIVQIPLLLPFQIAGDKGAYPPALGGDGFNADQPGAAAATFSKTPSHELDIEDGQ